MLKHNGGGGLIELLANSHIHVVVMQGAFVVLGVFLCDEELGVWLRESVETVCYVFVSWCLVQMVATDKTAAPA